MTMPMEESATSGPLPTIASDRRFRGFLLLFFVLILLRNAWICEDAFITLRVVDNAVHGLGLRWNPLERVQVYTHPLWMFALIPARVIAGQAVAAAMGLSLVCSIGAVGLVLFRGMKSSWSALVAILVLVLSKAFVDYSTSGLENPLTHLLLGFFFIEYLGDRRGRRLERLVLVASLAACTRLDVSLFFVPPILQAFREERPSRKKALRVLLWLAPLVLWELFSILYYGFPFPNSYYAKLESGVSHSALAAQGIYYLVNSLSWDPITLLTIGALVLFCGTRRGDARAMCLAASVVLYIAYIVSIGGDYMSGRHLTAPLFVAVLGLSKLKLEPGVELYGAVFILAIVGLTAPRPPPMSWDHYEGLGKSAQGIDDERGYRYPDTGLLLRSRGKSVGSLGGWVKDGIDARERGDRVVVYRNIGYFGFFAGPGVHIIDPYGIGDPLIPRLPHTSESWDTGHFIRAVPPGYLDAAIDAGPIQDPKTEAYWQKVKLVTRAPIFDGARLREVFNFSVGLTPSKLR